MNDETTLEKISKERLMLVDTCALFPELYNSRISLPKYLSSHKCDLTNFNIVNEATHQLGKIAEVIFQNKNITTIPDVADEVGVANAMVNSERDYGLDEVPFGAIDNYCAILKKVLHDLRDRQIMLPEEDEQIKRKFYHLSDTLKQELPTQKEKEKKEKGDFCRTDLNLFSVAAYLAAFKNVKVGILTKDEDFTFMRNRLFSLIKNPKCNFADSLENNLKIYHSAGHACIEKKPEATCEDPMCSLSPSSISKVNSILGFLQRQYSNTHPSKNSLISSR